MTNFPLHSPPKTAGVYALHNRATGQIYIGQSQQLHRRYLEWKTAAVTKMGLTNHLVAKAFAASNPEDWTFNVLAECDVADLNRVERETIEKVIAKGAMCINGITCPVTGTTEIGVAAKALSVVLDEQGDPMTRGQIARRLGILPESVKKRLKDWRARGKYELSITDLLPKKP